MGSCSKDVTLVPLYNAPELTSGIHRLLARLFTKHEKYSTRISKRSSLEIIHIAFKIENKTWISHST